jgi:hypothetical protein
MGSLAPDPSQVSYAVCPLPETLTPRLGRKLAAMTIEAIRSLPRRILQYTSEYMKDTDYWVSLAKDSKRTVWICIAPNVKTGSTSLEEGQWIGITHLVGPLSPQEYYRVFPAGDREQGTVDVAETRWSVGRLFFANNHRNLHALSSLFNAVYSFTEKRSKAMAHFEIEREGRMPPVISRVYGCTHLEDSMYALNASNGGRVVAHLTRVQMLEVDRALDNMPVEFLTEEHYTKPVGALFEFIYSSR